jgi:hypothetical protein
MKQFNSVESALKSLYNIANKCAYTSKNVAELNRDSDVEKLNCFLNEDLILARIIVDTIEGQCSSIDNGNSG